MLRSQVCEYPVECRLSDALGSRTVEVRYKMPCYSETGTCAQEKGHKVFHTNSTMMILREYQAESISGTPARIDSKTLVILSNGSPPIGCYNEMPRASLSDVSKLILQPRHFRSQCSNGSPRIWRLAVRKAVCIKFSSKVPT